MMVHAWTSTPQEAETMIVTKISSPSQGHSKLHNESMSQNNNKNAL